MEHVKMRGEGKAAGIQLELGQLSNGRVSLKRTESE
jgi:hypothetical protein